MKLLVLLFIFLYSFGFTSGYELKKLVDYEEYKQLIDTSNNVLIFFNKLENDDQFYEPNLRTLDDVVDAIKGEGIVAFVDCTSKKGLKLCKLLKGNPPQDVPYLLKHYRNGEFNRVYDRRLTADAVRRFMKDPEGDLPYADESDAVAVFHPEREKDFNAILKLSELPVVVMFYAPWCGHCKKLKPLFSEIAREMTDEALLVAVDMTLAENKPMGKKYQIKGFPTVIHIHKGEQVVFALERTKDNFINFIRDPSFKPAPKPVENFFEGTDVTALVENDFEQFIAENPSVGVMFYAPWCGHCKNVKPEFIQAAKEMKKQNIEGKLAAIDVSIYSNVMTKYEIKGFPTFIYFKDGKKMFNFDHRTRDKIVKFMQNPSEKATASPPATKTWTFEDSTVVSLTSKTFDKAVAKKKYAFIIYYSPTCGHCTKTKPAFVKAAAFFAKNDQVLFGAVDCDAEKEMCKNREAFAYPAFELLTNGKEAQKYKGERTEDHFIGFVDTKIKASEPQPSQSKGIEFGMNIAVATPETFDNLVSKGKHVVLYFSAAEESQDALLNEINGAGQMATPGAFIIFDCNQHKEYCDQKKINKLPILHTYNNGKLGKKFKATKKEELLSTLSGKQYVAPFDFGKNVQVGTYLNFESMTSGRRSLVYFYAPWCEHCKQMKPVIIAAANKHKSGGLYVAVDCTVYGALCDDHKIKSFPTIKIFQKGQFLADYSGSRTVEGLIESFTQTKSQLQPKNVFLFARQVNMADGKNFTKVIGKERAMVMFFAPWCGHCKKAKPDFSAAAILNGHLNFVAVDCTRNHDLCKEHGAKAYPTIIIFENGKLKQLYDGPRDSTSLKKALEEPKPVGEPRKQPKKVKVPAKPEKAEL